MPKTIAIRLAALACGGLAWAGAVRAQDAWQWPEKPANLQVFPKDWTGERLAPVMRGFTRALGVRCTHCHVGVEGKPLTTYDFVSDANPNKDRARAMLRMLGDVNKSLEAIQPSGDKRVNMWCTTCHRGRPRPMTLGEELGETFRKSGVDAALERYRVLKDQFYSRGAYDFGPEGLNGLGYEVLNAKDPAGAIKVFQRNADLFPVWANAWDSLGEAHLAAGDLEKAEAAYRKSLELQPANANARQKLEDIRRRRG
jgi:tetratricopeptide (TPR) repeat protein